MKKLAIIGLCVVMLLSMLGCQTGNDPVTDPTGELFNPKLETGKHEDLSYLLWVPEIVTDNMPLVVYLHDGNLRGSQPMGMLTQEGFPRYLAEGQMGKVPAYILMPQLPDSYTGWKPVYSQLIALIDSIVQARKINPNRISLTGYSMGGTGAWSLAIQNPDKFSCVVPLSGSVDTTAENLAALENTTVWAIVGSADDTVSPSLSQKFLQNLQKTNENAFLTVIEGASHRQVPDVYLDRDVNLIYWMILQAKTSPIT